MNPQEKAKELVDKFKIDSVMHWYAKQCALIAVDEILTNSDLTGFIRFDDPFPAATLVSDEKYWQQVKAEIEKL